jgi:hypothetical protein
MSRKPSFANLRGVGSPAMQTPITAPAVDPSSIATSAEQGPTSRQGRKQIAGFFTPEMSFAMHTLARRQGRSLQALMAEAFNDVLRKYGESPIGD